MKKIILVSSFLSAFCFTLNAQDIFQLKNKLTGTYLNTEEGKLQSSEINTSQKNAQWQFIDIGTEQFKIKNLGDGTFLHIEHGSLSCSAIQDNWMSAKWKVKRYSDSNFIEINNLWQTKRYLNMQNGLECSEVLQDQALSAQWEYEIDPNRIVYKDAGPSQQLTIAASNPSFIPVYNNDNLTFAYNNKNGDSKQVMLSSYKKQGEQFSLLWTKVLPNSLDKLGGFTTDGKNYYCFTVKDEALSNDPSVNSFRDNVLRLVKVDESGNEIWSKEINNKTYLSGPVYSPLVAGTGGLAYGNGFITLVFAKNTEWDSKINTRHQNALFVTVNALTGEPTKPGAEVVWHHSFDQRVIFDGKDFVFMDLGDPGFMPAAGITIRKIVIDNGEVKMPDPMYFWSHGAYIYARQGIGNKLYTSMGNIVASNKGYSVLFSSAKKNVLADDEPRNVGFVHVVKNFEQITDGMDNGKSVITNFQRLDNNRQLINITSNMVDTKSGNPLALDTYSFTNSQDANKSSVQTGLLWLTNYDANTNFISAERPKLIPLSNGQFIALWEEWIFDKANNNKPEFSATKSMLIDEYGNILKDASNVHVRLNLSGADLPCVLEDKAAWITRDEVTEPFNAHTGVWEFNLHTVDGNLQVKNYLLPK